jgi:DNA polymerase-3 subunit delta'
MQFFHEVIGHPRALEILQSLLRTGEVAHALLFSGEEGIGKQSVARLFAQTLLCQGRSPSQEGSDELIEPCGRCLACKKMADKNHPDFSVVEPEGTTIKIEQVREIQERIIFRPLEGARKILLIDPADKMNNAAANALLKTLEEPPPYALLILIASKPSSLPETLLSRCQKIPFHPLSLSQIETLLMERRGWGQADARLVASLTGGKLGEALSLELEPARQLEGELHTLVSEKTLAHYETLFEVAVNFSRDPETMERSLHYLSAWFRDVLVLQSVPDPARLDASYLVYSWRREEIQQWAARMNTHEVGKFLADLQEIRQAQVRNINRQLALETLLMQLRDKLALGIK